MPENLARYFSGVRVMRNVRLSSKIQFMKEFHIVMQILKKNDTMAFTEYFIIFYMKIQIIELASVIQIVINLSFTFLFKFGNIWLLLLKFWDMAESKISLGIEQ